MKIVQFSEFGTPHAVCACVDAEDAPPPGAGEATFDVMAFPINPADLLTIEGAYASRPELPYQPGAESVGRVRAVGAGVTHVKPGDLVLPLTRENWGQAKTVPAGALIRLPDDIDIAQAAMLKVNPATALLMLRRYVELQPGDWVIQDAANSSVGRNVIRLAKREGIKTVNIVRRPELIDELMAEGADAVVVDGPNLAERVAGATGGAEIRLGLDAVAGPFVRRLADCLSDGGTIVTYGLLSEGPCELTAHQVVFRGLTLTGFWLVTHLGAMTADERAHLYADLSAAVAAGALGVPVEKVYPIEEIRDALKHAEREGRDGKILVAPNGAV